MLKYRHIPNSVSCISARSPQPLGKALLAEAKLTHTSKYSARNDKRNGPEIKASRAVPPNASWHVLCCRSSSVTLLALRQGFHYSRQASLRCAEYYGAGYASNAGPTWRRTSRQLLQTGAPPRLQLMERKPTHTSRKTIGADTFPITRTKILSQTHSLQSDGTSWQKKLRAR